MERYIFSLFVGERATYREEILAAVDEDAVELAADALNEVGASHAWTLATLTDLAGRVVWQSARAFPKAPDL